MSMTEAQAVMLAELDQAHKVHRVPDDSPIGEQLLSACLTGTRAYICQDCQAAFTIDLEGEVEVWLFVPLVD